MWVFCIWSFYCFVLHLCYSVIDLHVKCLKRICHVTVISSKRTYPFTVKHSVCENVGELVMMMHVEVQKLSSFHVV